MLLYYELQLFRELALNVAFMILRFKVDEMYREAPIKNGNFDYIEFTRILKHGKKDVDDN